MQHKRLLEEQGERERWQRTWAACREREIHEGSEGSGMKTCMFLIGRCPWFDKNFKVYEPQWHEPKRQSRHQARKQHQSDYHHNIYVESWRSRRLVSHLLASLATFDYNQQQQSKTQWTTKAIDKILNSCVEEDNGRWQSPRIDAEPEASKWFASPQALDPALDSSSCQATTRD